MSDVRSRHAACLIAAVVSVITAQVFPSHAARPLITDDARIVDPKSCQVEAWRRRNEDTTEYWALPGCNPTGNAEITVGGAFIREAGALHTSDVQAQVKTLFKTLEPNGWAIGLVLGYLDHKADGHRDVLGRFYSYVPASFSFANDAFVLHTNVGTLRASDESRHRLTWGVGSETRITPNLFLVAEAFKLERDGPHYQAGIRFWIVPNRVQVDATIGDRIGHSNGSRWYSVGLRLLSPPFLP